MKEERAGNYAIAGSGSDICIVGGCDIDPLGIFDTASLLWKIEGAPCKIQSSIKQLQLQLC